jgi:hypothetical protein
MENAVKVMEGIDILSIITPILNFCLLVGISPIFWLTVLGPTFFGIALKSLRLGAFEQRQDEMAADVHPAVRIATEARGDNPAYALLNFTIQFFTLFASLVGLNLAVWRMVLLPAVTTSSNDWATLHPHFLILKGILLTTVTFILLVSGFFGRPNVISSYARKDEEAWSVFGMTLPPNNRITICRVLCAVFAAYLVYLAYFGFGVRIL